MKHISILSFIVTLFLLSSCYYKGNGTHFYVKNVDGKYIYHSNTMCPILDGTYNDFDLYDVAEGQYDFCWLCMDDNLIEECQKEIDKSIRWRLKNTGDGESRG